MKTELKMKIGSDIAYVGVNDHEVDLFEGQYAVPLGMAYNSYVIPDAKVAELLGEVVTNSTKKNLEMRKDAEAGACAAKLQIAARAKQLGYDAIHDTVHEMAKDEARHGAGFAGLYNRYFK